MANRILYDSKSGITARAYPGDGSVLLAMSLDNKPAADFAGFAIRVTPPAGAPYYLPNRLNYHSGPTAGSSAEDRVWTPSDQAPFHTFRWVNFPPDGPGDYTYEIHAVSGARGSFQLTSGPALSLNLGGDMSDLLESFEAGFTRGYIGSQAYADKFHNAEIRPDGSNVLFDAAKFEKQWQWLGFRARKMIYDFLDRCVADPDITVDLFAYDIDEPVIIGKLKSLGGRLRAILDDAPLHRQQNKDGGWPEEVEVFKQLKASAGEANVIEGHFARFQHNKTMLQRRRGVPVRVLSGSANFSIRGLYVQANNVMVFDSPDVAALYGRAFDAAFQGKVSRAKFAAADIAKDYLPISGAALPGAAVAFSPHADWNASLGRIQEAIAGAKSSVIFAVMEMSGGGPVLEAVSNPSKDPNIFIYGITQTASGIGRYNADSQSSEVASFAVLNRFVPKPFRQEWGGGAGQTIHHKFVVVDFNDLNPVVFTGSSNLSSGGETDNGDNLVAIYDPEVATEYAVEGIRLVDHYHFRNRVQNSGDKELKLDDSDQKNQPWWTDWYTPGTRPNCMRALLVRAPVAAAGGATPSE